MNSNIGLCEAQSSLCLTIKNFIGFLINILETLRCTVLWF